MSLLLEPLIYTSLPGRGFATLASDAVDEATRQVFFDEIVSCHWNAYDPPPANFRAVFLHWDPACGRTLFGWLYNDGRDEIGRANVPYFLCYRLRDPLDAVRLERVFAALERGPLAFVERANLPTALVSVAWGEETTADAARPGVALPAPVKTFAREGWRRGEPVRLFVAGEEDATAGAIEALTARLPVAVRERRQSLERRKTRRTPRLAIAGAVVLVASLAGAAVALWQPAPPAPAPARIASSPAVRCQSSNCPSWQQASARTVGAHPGPVWASAVRPDGRMYASGDDDGAIRLWSPAGGLLQALEGHTGTVRAVVFTPDGRTLASAGSDRRVRLWDVGTGKLRRTLKGHSQPVWTLAMAPDGRTLASGSGDRSVRLWDIASGRQLYRLRGHGDWVFAVAFSPDGRTLASAGKDETIRLWNSADGELLATLRGHSAPVRALDWSQDGRTLASASWDKTVALWDMPGQTVRTRLSGHTARVTAVGLAPDGQLVASGSIDGTVRLWQPDTRRQIRRFDLPDWVLSLGFSRDGQILIAGGKDSTLRLWKRL
ncbi:WD40 repeat domain-containing protein [Gloeobacter morelensis]|uniref:WD40 repeat domain-containing protein n=1 Tax=Gloeobacter morelensis MG652769 TaxID=2781736 RepID=A0ABY3PGR9_9CYAN|nr:WD40 repeat domain-containing protein [Gloeobacter morelensis]UFP92850.1 WD40 repeat domain-containing protein [Gloeobacter morelensis MG652769]